MVHARMHAHTCTHTYARTHTHTPVNKHSKCQHTTGYAGSGEDGAPQEHSSIGTKALHNFVPSRAKNGPT